MPKGGTGEETKQPIPWDWGQGRRRPGRRAGGEARKREPGPVLQLRTAVSSAAVEPRVEGTRKLMWVVVMEVGGG